MPKHSKYSSIENDLAKIVGELLDKCGVSTDEAVIDRTWQYRDDTVTALTTLITKEKAKAERAVVERVKLHKDHPLLSPAKRRDANNTIDYIVADLEAQLTKDKESK